MDCRKCQSLFEDYLHNQVGPREKARFDDHLLGCSACREMMAEYQALETLLDGASEWKVEVPPYLSQRIMANLPARTASALWSWKVVRSVLAAASLVIAIGIGFFGRDILLDRRAVQDVRTQSVRIIFYSPDAASVALIGDFNAWGQQEVTLAETHDRGMWEFSLSLKPGVYHYNLLVDGERWAANPKSSTLVPDGFGGYNSVLVVSEKCQDDCS